MGVGGCGDVRVWGPEGVGGGMRVWGQIKCQKD